MQPSKIHKICTSSNLLCHMNANAIASDAPAPLTLAHPPDSSGTLDASCCPGRTLPDRAEFSARQAGSQGSTDRKFHNNAYPLLCTTSTTPFDSGGCKGFCLPLPLFYNTCTESSCVDACTCSNCYKNTLQEEGACT